MSKRTKLEIVEGEIRDAFRVVKDAIRKLDDFEDIKRVEEKLEITRGEMRWWAIDQKVRVEKKLLKGETIGQMLTRIMNEDQWVFEKEGECQYKPTCSSVDSGERICCYFRPKSVFGYKKFILCDLCYGIWSVVEHVISVAEECYDITLEMPKPKKSEKEGDEEDEG